MAEFIAENWAALLWFLAAVALLAVELATVQLVSIWFCLGAVAATVAAIWGAGGTAQLGVFFVVSAAALALTRPMVQRVIQFKKVPTNADSFIGMAGSVLLMIPPIIVFILMQRNVVETMTFAGMKD